MIHLANAPSRGARLLARKRRIPSRTSPATTVNRENALSPTTSTTEYRKGTTTTEPTVDMSDLLVNSTAVTETTDAQQTTQTDQPTVVDTDVSSERVPRVNPNVTLQSKHDAPSESTNTSPPHLSSTVSEETPTPSVNTPVPGMKILNLANTVDSNKHQGCFSSSGNRPVSSRATLASDCRHQNANPVEKIKLSLLSTVSLKRAAIQATATGAGNPVLHFGSNMTAIANGRSAFGGGSLHGGVNVLLGGAMLSGLILLVFFICYCCQRSARKHENNCRSQHWIQDPEAQLEVFTLEGQRFERSAGLLVGPDAAVDLGAFLHANTPSPPPPYDAVVCKSVVAESGSLAFTGVCDEDLSDGLPTYEAALKLEAERTP